MSGAGRFVRHGLAATTGRRMPFALSYHGLGEESPEDDPHGLMTHPDAFAAQLDALLGLGYRLVGVSELWDAVARGEAEGLGAITFDDGLADSMHAASALCAERGVTPTMFLAPGLFGEDHPDLPPGRRILRADEVPALEAAGAEIGAHSHGHVELPVLPPERQRGELRRSRAELEALLGHPVTTMAYPFGRHDATTVALAAEAGYTVACANDGAGPWAALALPREPVHPSTSLARLRLKSAGLYGPVLLLKRLKGRRPGFR
ncbi:MAG: polysaccharide deacetylase [Solirubrobacterales bacterium]|nr:polysaccharide deacetylase [Solirubrobacterales bacterium]